MLRKFHAIAVCIMLVSSVASAAHADRVQEGLSAAQVVEKNVAARGGLQAWRQVKTLSLEGKMGVGGNQRATLPVPPLPGKPGLEAAAKSQRPIYPQRPVEEVQLPFVLELARSHKMRFELQFNGHTGVQVFDGAHGWKVRPHLNRNEIEPFTADEMKIASMQADLDGYLVDYVAKGSRIELAGMEKVENRDTYKLKLTLQSGQVIHVWIDANTFLEAKIEGHSRRLDGAYHPVEVYFRDYRAVSGLQIPFVLETKVLPLDRASLRLKEVPVPVERITVEKVVVNPQLEESRFLKPQLLAAASVPAAHTGN
jgi:hypothetical protein